VKISRRSSPVRCGVVTRLWYRPRHGPHRAVPRAHGIDLAGSTHVGDSESDRGAAAAADIGTFVPAREFFGWTDEQA